MRQSSSMAKPRAISEASTPSAPSMRGPAQAVKMSAVTLAPVIWQ